jgi:uncharacterized protein (TIGR02246 family)
MKIFLFLFLLFLFSAAVNVAAQRNSSRDEKTKNEIRAAMDAQVQAWNNGDIEGFMTGYWKSENLVFVSGDEVTKGWQQTTDRYKKNYNTREKMGVLTFSDLEITVISKDAAVVLGRWKVEHKPKDQQGRFTLIFRKFKDGWKIVHDHTS